MIILSKKVGIDWQRVGQTEVIEDNLNPEWITSFKIEYEFESDQEFRIHMIDIDDKDNINDLSEHDHIGYAYFSIHELITALDCTLTKAISETEADARVIITGEPITLQNSSIDQFQFYPRIVFSDEKINLD